ncbi:MAG: HEPN family nuclease [Halodesulfovibrio sp.]|uniref:HEPN family nuclease n=1 Tax=Halodesulfovibrio sp. TaxID=1912772 RepID=UPI00359EEF02
MEHPPGRVVQDFAARTMANYRYVRKGTFYPSRDVYDVTQAINSLLGLVVIPMQAHSHVFENVPLSVLPTEKWPEALRNIETPFARLGDLMRALRNAIAHAEFAFASSNNEISSVTFSGTHRGSNWRMALSVEELEQLIFALGGALSFAPDATNSFNRRVG